MTRKERLHFLLVSAFLVVLPLLLRSLWEPDEARYAEIPREMLVLGDWLTPHLNFVPYFEKPPLQYWLSACFMRLFGTHYFVVKLPLVLAGFISLWCGWRLAKLLGAGRPMHAVFMTATALLPYICGQILTLDSLFSAFQVMAVLAVLEAVVATFYGYYSKGWTLLAFISLALATLTKGLAAPLLVGLTAACSLPWTFVIPKLRSALLRVLFDPVGWLLFVVLVVPWFVIVDSVNPGHAKFFFVHEHFARFTSHVHCRQGSNNQIVDKLYFFVVLFLGLVPWLSSVFVGIKRCLTVIKCPAEFLGEQDLLHRWSFALVMLTSVWPLIFYTFSGSKLPPYILPAVVPVLAIACALERTSDEAWVTIHVGFELILLVLLFLPFYWLLADSSIRLGWVMLNGVILVSIGFWAMRLPRICRGKLTVGLGFALLVTLIAATKVVSFSKDISTLLKAAPINAQWISCGRYFQSIPFTTGNRVVVVGKAGELSFGSDCLNKQERDLWFYEDETMFTSVALRMQKENQQRPVWALVAISAWKNLSNEQKRVWDVRGRSSSCLMVSLKQSESRYSWSCFS